MERLTERNKKGCAYFNNDGILIRGANGTFHQKKDITAHYIHDRFVALDKVIDRLAAYEDTGLTPEEIMALVQPPNDQLTLEELREMGLFEWLWVEVIHPTKSQLLCKVESAYYQVFEDYTDGDAICCGWPGLIHDFAYEDYGKNWLAYRRKPEEEARRDA